MRRNRPRFNADEADRVVEFFQTILYHIDGLWAGSPFMLADWQREEIIRPLYGWQRFDEQFGLWVRQFSEASIWMPRGDGKTEIGGGVVLEGLAADGEYGAEVYGAAEDRDQAAQLYRVVNEMRKFSPALKSRLVAADSYKRIDDPETGSFYRALPRDELGTGAQGFRLHVGLVDEYHVQKTPLLVQALRKGMGKRVQPLFVTISSAGEDLSSPAGQDYQYAKKVRDARARGEELDPSWFVYIAEADAEDDPFDERVWHKANPALGDFLSIETLRREARKARETPSELNDFLRFRLGLWVHQQVRWIALHQWDASAGMVDEAALKGRSCYGGLHATSAIDLASVCWDFPGEAGHDAIWRFFLPEERLPELDRRTANQASVWVRERRIQLTSGNVIDFEAIKSRVKEDADTFRVEQIAYPRWGNAALQTVLELQDDGLPMVAFGQGIKQQSSPTKELEKLVVAGTYRHSGNPVMRWTIDNVAVRRDPDGDMKVDQERSGDNVCGAMAAVMALDGAMRHQEDGFLQWMREEAAKREAKEEAG